MRFQFEWRLYAFFEMVSYDLPSLSLVLALWQTCVSVEAKEEASAVDILNHRHEPAGKTIGVGHQGAYKLRKHRYEQQKSTNQIRDQRIVVRVFHGYAVAIRVS